MHIYADEEIFSRHLHSLSRCDKIGLIVLCLCLDRSKQVRHCPRHGRRNVFRAGCFHGAINPTDGKIWRMRDERGRGQGDNAMRESLFYLVIVRHRDCQGTK